MLRKQALLDTVASQRGTRQIISFLAANSVAGAAGATSLAVPWVTVAGAVTANVRNYLVVGLKPGTANLGAVATPAGWTLVTSHIGGGYGTTLGADTGNCRVFLYIKDNDNTSTGTLTVNITPDGANGVASANMGRLEKTKGTWQAIATTKGEATVDTTVGSYALATPMVCSRGDVLIYGFTTADDFLNGTALGAGPGLTSMTPPLAKDATNPNGFHMAHVSTGRRAQRGLQLGTQTLTVQPTFICRGPMVIGRMRVR
jgi:hypothetical protein